MYIEKKLISNNLLILIGVLKIIISCNQWQPFIPLQNSH